MSRRDIIQLTVVAAVCVVGFLLPEKPLPSDYMVHKCFWGSILGAAFQVVGTVAANARQNKAIREQRKALGEEIAEERAEANANYLDRADAQAALREVRQQNKDQLATLNIEGVKRGMTDEAKIAAAGRANRSYADVVSRISAIGSQYKDRARERMRNAQRNLRNVEYQTNMAQAQGIASASSGAASAANDLWDAVAAKRNIGK